MAHDDAPKASTSSVGAGGGNFLPGPVLVTGASGFIGSHLCDQLLQFGVDVHASGRTFTRAADWRGEWSAVDLTDAAATSRLFRRVQPVTVFHLASLVPGDRSLAAVVP